MVIGTIDAGSGALAKSGYAPFGESATTSGTYRYTARRIDAETGGLYYYRSRMYDPTVGRFLQTDAAGYAAGTNLYSYVSNDPLNRVDPSGTIQEEAAGASSESTVQYFEPVQSVAVRNAAFDREISDLIKASPQGDKLPSPAGRKRRKPSALSFATGRH